MLTNEQKDAKSEALNSILRRISKLFALAERAGSVHEAEAALSKAKELLDVHDLTEADVEGSAQEDIIVTELKVGDSRLAPWKRHLASVLGNHYFCQVIQYRSRQRNRYTGKVSTSEVHYKFCGFKADVAVTVFAFEFVGRVIERLAKRHAGDKRSFRVGVVAGLADSLQTQRNTANAGFTPTGKDLVATRAALIDRFVDQQFNIKRSNARPVFVDMASMEHGVAVGKKIQIGTPVQSGSQPLAIRA